MPDDCLVIASQVRAATSLQLDIELCKLFVRDAFSELKERTLWSWLIRHGSVVIPAPYATGTVSFENGSNVATGTGTAWDRSMIGRQFRTDTETPLYTVTDVTAAGTAYMDTAWQSADISTTAYQIIQAYWTPPHDDFFSFITVVDPFRPAQLSLNIDQSFLDSFDPRRTSVSRPVVLSPFDYAPTYNGTITPALQVVGSGTKPAVSGVYAGPNSAFFTVQLLSTGIGGVATFRWRKNEDAWSATTTSSATIGNILPEGLTVSWSPTLSYTSGDTFVSRATTAAYPAAPRFELYPYAGTNITLRYQYLCRYPELDVAGLPRYIPAHVVKEGALGRAARTSSTDERPNPYAQRARAENHEDRFNIQVAELMRQDEEVFARSVQQSISLPFAPLPWGRQFAGYNGYSGGWADWPFPLI